MTEDNVAQFRFSSGHEIVCEVMEWSSEESRDIIVRNAMAIVMGETPDGERVYVFKPWAHFLESPREYIMINSLHVVSTNRPNKYLLQEYIGAVREMHTMAKEREEEYQRQNKKQTDRFVNSLRSAFTKNSAESESSNILKFPGNDDTFH